MMAECFWVESNQVWVDVLKSCHKDERDILRQRNNRLHAQALILFFRRENWLQLEHLLLDATTIQRKHDEEYVKKVSSVRLSLLLFPSVSIRHAGDSLTHDCCRFKSQLWFIFLFRIVCYCSFTLSSLGPLGLRQQPFPGCLRVDSKWEGMERKMFLNIQSTITVISRQIILKEWITF